MNNIILLFTILLLSLLLILKSYNKKIKEHKDYLQLQVVDDTLYLYDNGVLIQEIPQSNTCELDSFLIDYYY
jgi:hypothetical protein